MAHPSEVLKRNSLWLRRFSLVLMGIGRSPTEAQGEGRHASLLFQSAGLFRFFSFAMGAGLAFSLEPDETTTLTPIVTVVLVGVYNAAVVGLRLDPRGHRPAFRWLNFGVDIVLALAIVLSTGGLDSPFLIYSLAPVLTANLFMDLPSSTFGAVVLGMAVAGAHVAAGLDFGGYPWILDASYLAFALLYGAVCLLVAYLPFLANFNWERHVRAQSIAFERSRLQRDLHDNVAQTLAFLSLKVKRAQERATGSTDTITTEDIGDIASVVERSYLAVRDYLDSAEEGVIQGPLAERLTAVADQWSRDTGLEVISSIADKVPELSPPIAYQLLQIAREALANVAKHALATQTWVTLEPTSVGLTLRIRDDGRGFSPERSGGHGTSIMRERAELIRAQLTISSALARVPR